MLLYEEQNFIHQKSDINENMKRLTIARPFIFRITLR